MKYLKSFNESMSYDEEIKKNLHDICLELEDEGFKVQHFKLRIEITSDRPVRQGGASFRYNYKDIHEVVERIKDYMNSEGYSTIVSCDGVESSKFNLNYMMMKVVLFFDKLNPLM